MNPLRQRKTLDPCPHCGLHRERCICHLIPKLTTRTQVCLIIHRREMKRTTNTGMLALKSLINSEIRIRGTLDKQALHLDDLLTRGYRSLVFFPSEDALPLTAEFIQIDQRPIQLIVPDGNWRQASKLCTRHPELEKLPRVQLVNKNAGRIHLRAEHRPEGFSTLEAIAHALGVIEGPQVMNTLLQLYDAKLSATLAGRGKLFHTTSD